ncbi:MAG: ABC transporter permease [Gemmatimonadota bacterium]
MFSDLRFRLRAVFRRVDMERDLDDELRFHIERETEKCMRDGTSRREAERRARLAFGGMTRIKDDTRDSRGTVMFETLRQDVRYALRGLRMTPGFTAAIVLTLGLGIGTNAAMFDILDRLMFRPAKYLSVPERVHRVFVTYLSDGRRHTESSQSYARFVDFARMTSSFDLVEAVGHRRLAVGSRDEAKEMIIATVSGGFFRFFDARPAQGRFLTPDDDRPPSGSPVAVLGRAFWQLRYGGANVINKKIRIGNVVHTIVGVVPKGFAGISEEGEPAAYIPVTAFAASSVPNYVHDYGWTWMDVIVRRRAGVSREAADADLSRVYAQSWELEGKAGSGYPSAASSHTSSVAAPLLSARGPEADETGGVATWVMGVAVIVLLVACANVTNLLLARAVKRRREIALRLALGVTRRRLFQQLLTESLLLAVFGGVIGMLVAQLGAGIVRRLFLQADGATAVATDVRTMLFVAVTTVSVALLTGLAPALHSLNGDVADALKAGSREGAYRRSGVRTALLLFQGAFSVVLLVGAGLFVRSLSNVRSQRMGYDVSPIVYADGVARGVKPTRAEVQSLSERLVAAALSVPHVENATLTISVPFWSSEGRGAPKVPGVDSLRTLGSFRLQAGSPSYFKTMGTRILHGRAFNEADRATTAPVVLVNEAMAKAIWPRKDAVGQVMRIGSDTNPYMTVIGVAENTRAQHITGKDEFWYYLPVSQFSARFGQAGPNLFLRVNGRAEDALEPIRKRLQQEMPGDSYVNTVTLASLVSPRQRSWEFGAKMFVGFGVLALVLAAIGLYSVVSYMVAQRNHELGIRIALGAGVGDMLRMIVIQGVGFAAAGIAIGSVIALWAGRKIEPLLFSQKANDPSIYGLVAAMLLLVAILATLRPALRAARVDPMVALRSD